MKTKRTEVIDNNKTALLNAARVESGKLIINRCISMLKDSNEVPLMVKMVLDTPFAPIIVGNMLSIIINETMDDTPKTEFVKDALVEAAAFEMISKLNIQKLLTKLMNGVTIPKGYGTKNNTEEQSSEIVSLD